MGLLNIFGDNEISIHDWSTVNTGIPRLEEERTKVCSTKGKRFVVTNENDERPILYTKNLITCLGVLIHGNSRKGHVAGLVHALAGNYTDAKKVGKVVQQLNKKYRPSKLSVQIIIGDEPDVDLFNKIIEVLDQIDNIDSSNIDLIYGGENEPGFENGFSDPIEYSAKVAYDTKSCSLRVGADKKRK